MRSVAQKFEILSSRIAVLAAIVSSAYATIGFDGVQSMSTGTFNCLSQNGYQFFIARVWESLGDFDEVGIQNIKTAKAAGWQYVDGYIFPCLSSGCAGPAQQVEATVNRLRAEGADFGMLWLDIEIFAWGGDLNWNRNFILAMGNQLTAMGVNWGVYTNGPNWQAIVGLDWNGIANRPLWWADWNNAQTLDDFIPFGGWSRCAMKQIAGDVAGPCGVALDNNFY